MAAITKRISLTTSEWDVTRYVAGTPTSEVTLVTNRYIHPSHHGHTSQYHGHEWMTHIISFHVNRPSHSWDKAISDSELETRRSWARSYSRPSILLIRFLFISHQPDKKFLSYSYFEIWRWNIQGQGHELGQRSWSHIISSIQSMHFLFVSHQSDQRFLRYGQNSFDRKKTHPNFWMKICQNNNKTSPKSDQIITMARAIKPPCLVVIG